ncbi:MAG: translation initiation factor IF-3 [Verrucomicrobia bacterium]|nr:translation initiation factor IF-3 [Verrucomicrobiota bacterium]
MRVIGQDGSQIGVITLAEALTMARNQGVDLVEIAATATPPVCRLVDFGKFRYEQAKKDKESKKHQHANKVKEIQLSATIDPHDLGVKLTHAVDFLCDDMKVKIALRFRGREMAHTEFGFQVVNKFIQDLTPYGHPDNETKLVGRSINVMVSPLPRNKRAKNPRADADGNLPDTPSDNHKPAKAPAPQASAKSAPVAKPTESAFANNPFASLDIKPSEESSAEGAPA